MGHPRGLVFGLINCSSSKSAEFVSLAQNDNPKAVPPAGTTDTHRQTTDFGRNQQGQQSRGSSGGSSFVQALFF
jgi:hypothetical protein